MVIAMLALDRRNHDRGRGDRFAGRRFESSVVVRGDGLIVWGLTESARVQAFKDAASL